MSQVFEHLHQKEEPTDTHHLRDLRAETLEKHDITREKTERKSVEKNAALETCGVLPMFVIMDGHHAVTLHKDGSATVTGNQEGQVNSAVTATPDKLKTSTSPAGAGFRPAAGGGGADGGPANSAGGGGADGGPTTAAGRGGPFNFPAQPAHGAQGGKSHDQTTTMPSKLMSELKYIASLYNPFN